MNTRLDGARSRRVEQVGVDMSEFQVLIGINSLGKTSLIDLPSVFGELLRSESVASVIALKTGILPTCAATLTQLQAWIPAEVEV